MSERHDFDITATIVRGQAPARAVTVQRAVAFSGRLTHQLDYVVYLHVLFALNSGLQATVPGIVTSIREAGVRSAKSGTELVGRDAVYESFARLIEARFIRRTTIPNPKGKGYRGLTSYEVYEHFEDNPDYVPETPAEEPETKLPVFAETPVSAGQTISGVRGNRSSSGVRGSRGLSAVRGSGGAFVSAGQMGSSANTGNKVAPPHTPPEEVTTSSPYPLTSTTGSLPSQREGEGVEFPPEDLAAAERFLQTMRRPWQAGKATAVKHAPLLLRTMAEQGWPDIHKVDHQVLQDDILRYTAGARSLAHLLPKWIKDLRLYSVVAGRGSDAAEKAGSREAAIRSCQLCDDYGQIEIRGRALLCKHDGHAPGAAEPSAPAPSADAGPERLAGSPGDQPSVTALPDLADVLRSLRQPAV
ncbi:hypothetical protein ACWGIN_27680 [Streptomyces sp. NPDC054861]